MAKIGQTITIETSPETRRILDRFHYDVAVLRGATRDLQDMVRSPDRREDGHAERA